MKKILLSILVAFSGISMSAQATCATATTITANGTLTSPTFTGTYVAGCLASRANIKAIWYKYTPTANGEITISSNLPVNDGVTYTNDTRLSVLEGTCATYTCVGSNDDISATNYLSQVTVPVTAGTTYYIEWDNYWNAAATATPASIMGFQFTFNFTAVSCIRPGANDFYLPDSYTTTSAALYWDQAIGNPASYDTDWSATLTTAAGAGTITNSLAGTLAYATTTISSLPASANFRYYVRSNCGATQSAWQGPYYGYLASTLPYTNTFEDAAKNYTDGFIGFTRFTSSATTTPANYADGGAGNSMYTLNSTTAVSNTRAYSRAMNLQAGQVVTVTFKARLYSAAAASPMNLNLTVGNAQTAAGQATVVQSFPLTDATAFVTKTATYTVPTTGVYYFGLHNNSAIGATQTFAFVDTFNATGTLSTEDFKLNSFVVSPNPASSFVNISNTENATINAVSISDLNGRTIKQIKLNNVSETQINISDLSAGVYMMNISSDQGSVTKKIIKN
jgi:hypothetical protein